MRRTSSIIAAAIVVLVAACAPAAMAQDAAQGVPDAIEDPAGAIAPEAGAQDEPIADVAGIADATVDDEAPEASASGAPSGATSVPSGPTVTGTGGLPFTGPAPGQLLLLFVVGSLVTLAGIVASAWAAARAEFDR